MAALEASLPLAPAAGAVWRRAAVVLVVASAFGPYVLPEVGLRVEHFVVYPLLLLVLGGVAVGAFRGMLREVWLLLALWTASTVWMLAVSALSASGVRLATFAALDNHVEPIAIMVILGLMLSDTDEEERRSLLETSLKVIIAFLAANAVLSIASTLVETAPVLKWFITTDTVGETVASKAAQMGRFSGVFNQPFEAGVAYSVGLLGWVYLVLGGKKSRLLLQLSGGLLVAGGLLSVSKAFVLIGLPLAVAYAISSIGLRHQERATRLFLAGGAASAVMLGLAGWSGWPRLLRLFERRGMTSVDLVSLYSGGRFASSSVASGLWEQASRHVPLQGFGLGAHSPLDTSYLEFFYQGGWVALSLYLVFLAALGLVALRLAAQGREGRLMLVLWLLVVVDGLGAPVLSINRACVLLWVVMLLVLHLTLAPAETVLAPGGD